MSLVVRWALCCAVVCSLLGLPAAEGKGTLFIIGGGLRPNNTEVLQKMLDAAGGAPQCRVAVFRTASSTTTSAERFRDLLACEYQVPRTSSFLIDIHPGNAAKAARDLDTVKRLATCNIAFFTGGDQQRITDSLLEKTGADTPVLTAVRGLLARGGVVAGSSAGAAMQSETMITAGGLPDDYLDEGMDALDFGRAASPQRRGMFVSKGLGFLKGGIIDQHFSQYRGRLGRLSRVLVSQEVKVGIGIDENTALVVPASGLWEVVGPGCVTVVNAKQATCTDGPLGCRLAGLSISCFQAGDGWDAAKGAVSVHPGKTIEEAAKDPSRGNYLIADIAGEGAVCHALFTGLATNTSRSQQGIALRYCDSFGHGYRYTFRKTARTQCWAGAVNYSGSVAVQDIELTIEPILSSLRAPRTQLPLDLPEGEVGTACQAVWFRGILAATPERALRPGEPLTRADLAIALAHSIRLVPPRDEPPQVADVSVEDWWHDELCQVLEGKLLELDARGCFRPGDPIVRQAAAGVLVDLYRRSGGIAKPAAAIALVDAAAIAPGNRQAVQAALENGLLESPGGTFRPTDSLTRGEAAVALCRCLGLHW